MKKVLLGVVLAAVASSAMAEDAKHMLVNIHCTTLHNYVLDDSKSDVGEISFKGKLYPLSSFSFPKKGIGSLVWKDVGSDTVTLSIDETSVNPEDNKYVAFDYTPDGVKHRCLVENDSE
ncbi:hypothetical protein AWI06_21925 [Enterobacter hormaechei subsp. xiangfangensis]|uniref:hypothetical protein n=1 Tax=Enterobacter hormaechei TaxID=158836 RepID=UPI0007502B27|nr:hypothetical protein [Enterobacter hormaechei]KUP98903.1 hypothetical protein AWI06_21925 [Enterobacter hormaechei subsp. xiangfangensis]MBT1773457.1 hypothetical protein [Enterobacter hormaechei subsp. xiangfangensis]MDN4964898.1 hypothetical protein [Enterobacter hormaechei]MDO6155177.1 hypothetical protein [Enterobacter hormaechei]